MCKASIYASLAIEWVSHPFIGSIGFTLHSQTESRLGEGDIREKKDFQTPENTMVCEVHKTSNSTMFNYPRDMQMLRDWCFIPKAEKDALCTDLKRLLHVPCNL